MDPLVWKYRVCAILSEISDPLLQYPQGWRWEQTFSKLGCLLIQYRALENATVWDNFDHFLLLVRALVWYADYTENTLDLGLLLLSPRALVWQGTRGPLTVVTVEVFEYWQVFDDLLHYLESWEADVYTTLVSRFAFISADVQTCISMFIGGKEDPRAEEHWSVYSEILQNYRNKLVPMVFKRLELQSLLSKLNVLQ